MRTDPLAALARTALARTGTGPTGPVLAGAR